MNKEQNINNLVLVESIESTNILIKKKIEEKAATEGTVILAGFQTKGKGQADNIWESDKDKNVLASTVWFPKNIKPQQQFFISMAVSLAIADLLKEYGLATQIKWPNDILVGNKKISGILIELGIIGDKISNVIIGMGINVNQSVFNKYTPDATSLFLESNNEHDVKQVAFKLSEVLSVRYNELNPDNFEQLKLSYLKNLFRYKKWAMYNDGSNVFEAMITDVEETGELILKTREGKHLRYAFKEVCFIGI